MQSLLPAASEQTKMLLHALTSSSSSTPANNAHLRPQSCPLLLPVPQQRFPAPRSRHFHPKAGVTPTSLLAFCPGRQRSRRLVVALAQDSPSPATKKKRKVVEHICLLKAKEGLSDEDEKDMLDFLYTTQYQMRGIVAVSLGRISEGYAENYTHAVFMRFQRKNDVEKFYENPFYLGVLKEHVTPYCHALVNFDYESEVEDDILHIFRKGEEFNYGVESLHLVAFDDSAVGAPAEEALASLGELTGEFPSLIVQSTQGSNFNVSSEDYTHVVVTRFRSMESFEMFIGSSEYKDVWRSKFEPITKKTLRIHFSVDPVGEEIM